jgi:hypothetical protein
MAQEAPAKKPTLNDAELYTVDKEKETVFGLVNEYTQHDSPIMRREAQKGRDEAARRGLTNSTIAGGNAIGKVLDSAMWMADKDAGYANSRKSDNLNALTQQDSSSKQLQGSLAQARATTSAASIRANSDLKVAAMNRQQAQDQLEASKVGAQLDRDSRLEIETMKSNTSKTGSYKAGKRTAYQSNQDQFMSGISNIDQTASGGTQQEQYNRLKTQFDNNRAAIDAWSQ